MACEYFFQPPALVWDLQHFATIYLQLKDRFGRGSDERQCPCSTQAAVFRRNSKPRHSENPAYSERRR
jgi:hypothetical protein